tara:strand:+ start:1635 stop:2474 length:840 start_codon:yes stop_codon:yes gene_type:complete
MKHITIIGCGLIGGSFAELVKKHSPKITICGIGRRKEPLENAKKKSMIDTYETSITDHSFESTDMVIIATPISTVLTTIETLTKKVKKQLTIVDFSSVKSFLNHSIVNNSHHTIIAAHPMGGLDVQGLEHASASILESCPMIMFNQNKNIETFFTKLSFNIISCSSYDIHDEWMCEISHGPYLIASFLPSILSNKSKKHLENLSRISAGGFKDTTRVCNSPIEWGLDIIQANQHNVLNLLDELSNKITEFRNIIQTNNTKELKERLTKAKETRSNIVDG